MSPRPKAEEAETSDSSLEMPCPVPKDRELKANTMLGLKGWLAQWAQFGAVGVIIGVATIGAYFYRVDMLDRIQADRDDRNQRSLDERERLKERDDRLRDRDDVQNRILQSLAASIDNQVKATENLRTDIKTLTTEIGRMK